jgi:hypothetical protein
MGYETKVILSAVADILQTSKDLKEAYTRFEKIANAEGIIKKDFDSDSVPDSEKQLKN